MGGGLASECVTRSGYHLCSEGKDSRRRSSTTTATTTSGWPAETAVAAAENSTAYKSPRRRRSSPPRRRRSYPRRRRSPTRRRRSRRRRSAPKHEHCLCLFDVDRTLTGKQNDTHHCPNNKVTDGIHDGAYGGGPLTLSDLGQNLDSTFCVKCYSGIISVGTAGGTNSPMRSTLVTQLNKGKMPHLWVEDKWVESHYGMGGYTVEAPLVYKVEHVHKHNIASSIRDWYLREKNLEIYAHHTHFFDDEAQNFAGFADAGYNALQISCGSRDSTKDYHIGWCGGLASDLHINGFHLCSEGKDSRRRSFTTTGTSDTTSEDVVV